MLYDCRVLEFPGTRSSVIFMLSTFFLIGYWNEIILTTVVRAIKFSLYWRQSPNNFKKTVHEKLRPLFSPFFEKSVFLNVFRKLPSVSRLQLELTQWKLFEPIISRSWWIYITLKEIKFAETVKSWNLISKFGFCWKIGIKFKNIRVLILTNCSSNFDWNYMLKGLKNRR